MYDTSSQPIEMQERYKKLPAEITDLFEYDTVGVVTNKIATEFGLNEDQMAALKMEIEMVLYLFMTREGFIERIQDSLSVEKGRAEGIAQKVSSDLFVIIEPILDFADSERMKAEEISLQIEKEAVIPPPAPVTNPAPEAETAGQTVTETTTVKPLRTFSDDVGLSRAHGYGAFRSSEATNEPDNEAVHRSSQDDIIKQ